MKELDRTRANSTQSIGRRLGRVAVVILATFSLFQIGVALFPAPEWVMGWLSCKDIQPAKQPRYVVLLGGSIPSDSGLIRAFYAAEFGRNRTGMTHIISMPADEDPAKSGPGRVRDELVLRGVSPSDILFESKALDTYQEAVSVREMLGDEALAEPLLIVTSPSHMRRAFLCFRKQGFQNVTCLPAENVSYEVDIGAWGFFRYTFWYRLGSQAEIARELVAMAVYKFRGWI